MPTNSKTVLSHKQCLKSSNRLLIFADASLTVYGALAFLCSNNNTSFGIAKSWTRVAPLKLLTLWINY